MHNGALNTSRLLVYSEAQSTLQLGKVREAAKMMRELQEKPPNVHITAAADYVSTALATNPIHIRDVATVVALVR